MRRWTDRSRSVVARPNLCVILTVVLSFAIGAKAASRSYLDEIATSVTFTSPYTGNDEVVPLNPKYWVLNTDPLYGASENIS